uniref:protein MICRORCHIDIA 7-like n=1 Tax=Erigeron canadensis TaxID=72917 RepID=UPI001CB9BBA2|nr:protein MICRORCHIDIA 7-like [Erigeron canadensis]
MEVMVKQELMTIEDGMQRVSSSSLTDNMPIITTESKKSSKDHQEGGGPPNKKPKVEQQEYALMLPALVDPSNIQQQKPCSAALDVVDYQKKAAEGNVGMCKQFWKAGDYDGPVVSHDHSISLPHGGMDHLRVHPRFLHSNATSHKWALGAFAELLDNSLDEVRTGATYVNLDVLHNENDTRTKMLLVEDNGGGMTPDKMRGCMSLGYSVKSKLANTIGQYGNGFKTSTMRLGADVIVFTRCPGKDGGSPTQSIGMLSYTFLMETGKQDIVVPMIDFEKKGEDWGMLVRSSPADWKKNMETVVRWSPYSSEESLLQQFDYINDQGTRIIIYNLWEDEEGQLELDFDTDLEDIQIRGVNRDPKKIEMANLYPNSRHFLTYRHSLRSYAAILYLNLPNGFKIFLRGKEIIHHNIVDDMMLTQKIMYKPTQLADGTKNAQKPMTAVVTIGFVKDAKDHIDVQGFNVYHKNRLIKPFWRVWNAAGSNGRGVIGVLEADFVEPAHDKQGFERTTVLSRLENRLIQMQKEYWSANCQEIGYAKRGKSSASDPTYRPPSTKDKSYVDAVPISIYTNDARVNLRLMNKFEAPKPVEFAQKCEMPETYASRINQCKTSVSLKESKARGTGFPLEAGATNGDVHADVSGGCKADIVAELRKEILELRQRLVSNEDAGAFTSLLDDLRSERDRNALLENQLLKANERIKEQTNLIDKFADERHQRDKTELNLMNKLKEATVTVGELRMQIKVLEKSQVKSEEFI